MENSTRRGFLNTVSALALAQQAPPSLEAALKHTARDLRLPGFVAGVVRNGKLDTVITDGYADLEKPTPITREHIFYVASLTKTFTAVMMMQYAQERKISLNDYLLDYPFLTIGLTPNRILDPNTRLKHILSHTSQGTPGDQYLYNGNRFNFVYGVFEKISGNTRHYDACAQELAKRITKPLGMTSTLSGHPTNGKEPRIVNAYFVDKTHPTATLDKGVTGATTHYPSTGMLTTVDDLARYMTALDENVLLTAESYAAITQPYTLNDGRKSTYGLGWSTQTIGGGPVHWHYGYGDSYAALLIRLPRKKTSFMLMSNCGAASAPFYLGFGNLLTSPFATAFLKHALPGAITEADELYAQAFLKHDTDPAASRALIERAKPTKPDRSLVYLLAQLAHPSLDSRMQQAVKAYDASGDFHPEVDLAIANDYKRSGNQAQYLARLRRIADKPGYGEEQSTRDACTQLGTALLDSGQELGRKYLWMAVQYGQSAGASTEALDALTMKMRR